MVEETNNRAESPTPRSPAPDPTIPDPTVRLDAAIANGNLSLPSHFGRYQVASRIGIGGFASVYSALDPELDSVVAIKVLAENHSANVAVRKRFVAEARVARRLGSDRLIGVFDLGETDDGRPFVVMEMAERGTLRQRLVKTGRPSHDDLLRLIEELAACMTAVHAQGVVHRDIKPSNLLFRAANPADDHQPTKLVHDDERLVLADFGLARDISDGASALTVGGGTEGYMAPEQADPRGKADYRADIYSATVVMAELTTGRHPQRLDLPSADISTAVLEALALSLSVDRETRPATAEAWRARLLDAYGREHVTAIYAAPPGQLDTAHLDPTKIQAPHPYDTDVAPPTEVPFTGMPPAESFVRHPSDERVPPPPPSLPLDPSRQPPPPRLDAPATPAEAETWHRLGAATTPSQPADQAVYEPGSGAPPDQARAEMRHEPTPAGAPAAPQDLAHQASSGPERAIAGDAQRRQETGAVASGQPLQPSRPTPPTAAPRSTSGPSARVADTGSPPPPTTAPSADATGSGLQAPSTGGVGAPGREQPRIERSRPSGPTTGNPPGQVRPPVASPAGPPPSGGRQAARPLAATPRPQDRVGPATPATGRSTPRGGRRRRRQSAPAPAPTPTMTPPTPVSETAQTRSKKHLKTAERLAKLERKQNRKLARRARRRRRVLRVVNFALALIRGALAGIVAWISGILIAAASLDVSPNEVSDAMVGRPGAQLLLIGGTILAFFWGLAYFPFPRSYEI